MHSVHILLYFTILKVDLTYFQLPPHPPTQPGNLPDHVPKRIYHSARQEFTECLDYYYMKKPRTRPEQRRALWPGYFLNETELNNLAERAKFRRYNATQRRTYIWENVRVVPLPVIAREKREAGTPIPLSDTFFHGCCLSRAELHFPKEAYNVQNQRVTIVQGDGCEQPLYTETCVSTCTECECDQPHPFEHRVVVEDANGEMSLDWVFMEGSCKCLNTHNP